MKTKWTIGIALIVILLLVVPVLRFLLPHNGYAMMGNAYGWHMPMMYGWPGMMTLIPVTFLIYLVLIVLGIAWLIDKSKTTNNHKPM